MINQITATIEFSFKGETHRPSVELDLDQLMQQYGTIPPLYKILATLHNIDSYSYEYEMLEAEEVQFSAPKGTPSNFFKDDKFDLAAYEESWQEDNILTQITPVIKQVMDIDDIHQHPDLKKVIIAAYQLGQKLDTPFS